MSDENAWYYCLTHGKAERGVGCRGGDRMGPYPDEATARDALELARRRTESEDKRDKEWNRGT
ncbi:hypothetical protein GCM10022243_39990 [Saccharothrix violaceirubra]|uniref:SPOR domain-containing protein n=1 Tax=Saccharothrix violaceirubra TaxID=413306 RepID=A0A7W7WYB2_9PSEU|nr:hypothetical protein [Saccharothrix violaceirubra]MBB4968255.1 hypothetical protein [Saccharothrix violaceirubra]